MKYSEETHVDLSYEHPNWIVENKIYVLPICIQTYACVEIYIPRGYVKIQSQHAPIRHGKHCGSSVHLGQSYGIIDLNPKFIWNGKEWLLNTFGTFIFAEIEVNAPRRNDENN